MNGSGSLTNAGTLNETRLAARAFFLNDDEKPIGSVSVILKPQPFIDEIANNE